MTSGERPKPPGTLRWPDPPYMLGSTHGIAWEIRLWASEHVVELFNWLANSEALGRRFRAGLCAYESGLFTYGGFLHRVFGDVGNDHIPIPELGWEGLRMVVDVISTYAKQNDLLDCEALLREFPSFNHFYDPEAFGKSEEQPG